MCSYAGFFHDTPEEKTRIDDLVNAAARLGLPSTNTTTEPLESSTIEER
jgi:hypothetical protein